MNDWTHLCIFTRNIVTPVKNIDQVASNIGKQSAQHCSAICFHSLAMEFLQFRLEVYHMEIPDTLPPWRLIMVIGKVIKKRGGMVSVIPWGVFIGIWQGFQGEWSSQQLILLIGKALGR